jgi:hypothetical protein
MIAEGAVGCKPMLGSPLLEATFLECTHIICGERKPFAALAPVAEAVVPIALDSFRIVRLDDVNVFEPHFT